LGFLHSGPDSSKLLQEAPCPAALRAAAQGDSCNNLEDSGPEWRNPKKPLIEDCTFACPRSRLHRCLTGDFRSRGPGGQDGSRAGRSEPFGPLRWLQGPEELRTIESETGLEIHVSRSQADGQTLTHIDSAPVENQVKSIQINSHVKGIPKWFLAEWFLEAWGTEAEKRHLLRKRVVFRPCRLRRHGQKTTLFLKTCGWLASVPQASNKNTWPNTNTSGSP
jgi:hypothetical protein